MCHWLYLFLVFLWFAWKYSKLYHCWKILKTVECFYSCCSTQEQNFRWQLRWIFCMYVFHGASSACVSRTVIFSQSDPKHFQCKTMPRTQSRWEGKASQSDVIFLLFFDTLVCSSCFNGFSLHWFNPVHHKIGWCFRISFHEKDNNETWLCLFYSWHLLWFWVFRVQS